MNVNKRPPDELESKLHQAALSAPNKELSNKQAETIIPDASKRQTALNFLLSVGLFKSLVDTKGSVSFRAVTKNELTATKDLSGEEKLVLGHIKSSRQDGIWLKHITAKTNLHKTITERCLKTLTQKRLIKRVSSVQYPTRKIYMLESLQPSVTLTGGPWFTDKELDMEFIKQLSDACLKLIRDISFPKRRGEGASEALFALSNSPDYPSAEQIRNSLRKARLTETDLSVEHVEMLLNVLVLDGEIERLPSFGTSMWNTAVGDDESGDESDASLKKRRDNGSRSKGKHRMPSDSDSDSENASRKKSKKKRLKGASDSDNDMPDGRRKKKRKRRRHDSDSSSSSEDEHRRKKSKKRRSKRSKYSSDSEDSSDEGSSHHNKSAKQQPLSSFQTWDELDTQSGSAFVYRAIRQECLTISQPEAPCSQCPSFEFCKDGGPVNPQSCVYFGDWLTGRTAGTIEIDM